MNTRARQGLGVALLGAVAFVVLLAVAAMGDIESVTLEAVLNLALLVAIAVVLSGVVVTAVGLIRGR